MNQALAPSTARVYKAARSSVAKFINYVHSACTARKGEWILLYIVFLAQVLHLQFSTITTYLAGVRHWFAAGGLQDPTLVNGGSNPRLNLLLRGIKRDSAARVKRVRKPLDIGKLNRIASAFDELEIPLFEKLRAKTACLLAFWGFLRSVDYCTTLKRKDISFDTLENGGLYITLHLRKTKTQQFEQTKVYIYSNDSSLCAVRAMAAYIKLTARYACKPESCLFSIPGSAFHAHFFNTLLKLAVKQAGLNPRHYSSHSLRSGAATTAANTGVPPYLIKKLGRWRSDTYTAYVRDPKKALRQAHQSMLE